MIVYNARKKIPFLIDKVSERKSENCGLLQGVFLKRGRVPKREGGYISLGDLKIGQDIVLYNRTFTVCG